MKKQSFFQRLAGNLRFDDNEEDFEATPVAPKQVHTAHKEREGLPVHMATEVHTPESRHLEPVAEEETGELPVDVYETAHEVIIQTLIAGVMPDHLTINITRDVVTISGKREENKAIRDENYHIRELYWGAFARTVDLPAEIEIDNAEAIERHGMLMIKLPKIDKGRKTALKIKSI